MHDWAWSDSWCTTKVCEGSADEVAAIVEGRLKRDTCIEVGGGRLDLEVPARGVVVPVAPSHVYPGRLRARPWWPATRVTLEVWPWSRCEAEILLRPRRCVRDDRYFAVALAVLEALSREVSASRASAATDRHPVRYRWAS
jgi:hypothetical protein